MQAQADDGGGNRLFRRCAELIRFFFFVCVCGERFEQQAKTGSCLLSFKVATIYRADITLCLFLGAQSCCDCIYDWACLYRSIDVKFGYNTLGDLAHYLL